MRKSRSSSKAIPLAVEAKSPEDPEIEALAGKKKAAVHAAALSRVPPSFLASSTLQEISLDSNCLTELPHALFRLPQLKKLSAANNYISVLPLHAARTLTEKGAKSKLSKVVLEGNPLVFPPPEVAKSGNWKKMAAWMVGNPSCKTYRYVYERGADSSKYIDFQYCSLRDTMVSSKDEDRDASYVRLTGATKALYGQKRREARASASNSEADAEAGEKKNTNKKKSLAAIDEKGEQASSDGEDEQAEEEEEGEDEEKEKEEKSDEKQEEKKEKEERKDDEGQKEAREGGDGAEKKRLSRADFTEDSDAGSAMEAAGMREDDLWARLPSIDRHKYKKESREPPNGPGWWNMPNKTGNVLFYVDLAYFGMFDGHAGAWVSNSLTTHLKSRMERAGIFNPANGPDYDYEKAIRDVWMKLDAKFVRELRELKRADGSTATVVFFNGNRMVTAWVGDSRAVAVTKKKNIDLSVDHDPTNEAEKQRIEERGGEVSFHKGAWRVNKNLSVTRAFGDKELKTPTEKDPNVLLLEADPEVRVETLEVGKYDWVLNCTDGVWHLAKSERIAAIVGRQNNAYDAAEAIFKEITSNTQASLRGHDNTSVIALKLRYGELPNWVVDGTPCPLSK